MALALLRRTTVFHPKPYCVIVGIPRNPTRFAGHWNYQYKPGQHPKTKEEYAAAAKKYGLPVLEYKPYPEDQCLGDYPKLPDIGADSKDPFYPYDSPELKRNFNEPVHYKFEIIGEDRADISIKPRFSLTVQWLSLFAALGGSAAIMYYLEDYHIGRPVTAKQYPHEGPHYMF